MILPCSLSVMRKLVPLFPLLASASLLLFANGLQSLLIAWRGSDEGFATLLIGFITATYYLGFAIGCVHITPLIRTIGHIRAFSAMASICTAAIIRSDSETGTPVSSAP